MATSPEGAPRQQYLALLLAKFVRDGLEDIHSRGDIPESLMPELNTAIRNAIYTGLHVIEEADNNLSFADFLHRQERYVRCSKWEAPTLWPQIAHPRFNDPEYLAQLKEPEEDAT